MHAFDVLGDPVRRRILELLATGERAAGQVVAEVGEEFGISQPAVSQHLKVLREAGFADVRSDGTRRLYSLDPRPLLEVDRWLTPFRALWSTPLDALSTEIARGARARRTSQTAPPGESTSAPPGEHGAGRDHRPTRDEEQEQHDDRGRPADRGPHRGPARRRAS